MDDIATELSDVVETPADLMDIANDNHDVDHAQVIEELNSFSTNNPDVDNFDSEQLRHGFVLPTIFAGIAVAQFILACVVFASLIYFIIRDYMELQQRRRLHAGNVRAVPGEEHGGDNNANDDEDEDDDERRGVRLPPAAPEGTPPSQFPSDIVRRRTAGPAAPAPPPPPPPASSAGAPRPVTVVQVSTRPMTLTVVDQSLAAAAVTSATTAATADGGSMDDGADIVNRLQSGSTAGAKPKKARYARKHQLIYRPRTIEDSHDETSRPTITDDNNVTLVTTTTTTTTTTNNEQHPADVTSASMTSDSTVNTPQSTIAGAGSTDPSSGVSVVDDRNSTSDQREVVSEDPITDVAPHRTQPSAQTRLQSTTEDPVTARHSRRVDLLDQATMTMTNTTPPTSSTKLRNHQSLNAAPTDTQNSHRQVSSQQPQHEEHKSQQGNVVCENDVCRLRVVTSNKQCHVARTFVTNHVSGAASDLLSTTTRDAKSEPRASDTAVSTSNRETTQRDAVVPGRSQTFADSSTGSQCVVDTQPTSQHISGSTPAVGGGAGIPGHVGTSQPVLPLRVSNDRPLVGVDENAVVASTAAAGSHGALPPPDSASSSPHESFSQLQDPASNVVVAAADNLIPDHHDDKDPDQVTSTPSAAADDVAHQSTAAAVPPTLASTDNVEEQSSVDTGKDHVSTATL